MSDITLGQIYLGESRPDEAAAVFRDLLSRRSGNRMVHSLLIDSLMRAGQPGEAERAMQDALDVDPGFTRARLSLAHSQSERGDHGGAVRTLEGSPDSTRRPWSWSKRCCSTIRITTRIATSKP